MKLRPFIERLKKMFVRNRKEARRKTLKIEQASVIFDLENARAAIQNYSDTVSSISKAKRASIKKLEECSLPTTIDSINEAWPARKR